MKILKKILLFLVLFGLILTVFVFMMRYLNDRRYGMNTESYESELITQYVNPTDLSLYQTTIPDLAIKHVEGNYLNGFHIKPNIVNYEGVIVTFGGSEGSPAYEQAVALAQEGYQVLSLFFFGMPNQVATLREVPVDYYEEIERYIRQELVIEGLITLIGTSKGAEYSLLLSTFYDSIDNVVLFAPSSRIFAGLDFSKPGSSWTFQEQSIDYLDFQQANFNVLDYIYRVVTKKPISYLKTYESLLLQEGGKIPVQNSRAKILAFAGGDDQMWPASQMIEEIVQVRPDNTEIQVYPEAGHIFSSHGVEDAGGIYMAMGGNEQANKLAYEDSWRILLNHLASWHLSIE